MAKPIISSDELNILSTAIRIVRENAERRRDMVLCDDRRQRRFTREEAVDLIDRLGQCAGYEPGVLKETGVELASMIEKEARR